MKNKKNKQQAQQPVRPKIIGISKRGRKVIFAGIGLLVLGFFVLTKTDPAGQNWASIVSPFMILGGYVIIGIGIILPEKQTPSVPNAQNIPQH